LLEGVNDPELCTDFTPVVGNQGIGDFGFGGLQRPTTRFVPAKTDEQLDLQALHRVRSRLVSERTAVINQMRGFLLERGIIVRQGLRFLRQGLPDILAKRTDVLSPRMVRIVSDLASDWRQLDERIEAVTDEIETLAKRDDSCRRVMTVPGIGPIISSAMVAAIGSGAAFAKGRDFSAWIGLVPKQMSTGDRTILGRISKRGNGYLRMLFIQAARVILLRPANWPKHGFGVWLARAAQRLHPNVLAAALANKLARIWVANACCNCVTALVFNVPGRQCDAAILFKERQRWRRGRAREKFLATASPIGVARL
jgi:transposase